MQPESDRFRAISARFGPIWPKSEIEKKEKKRKKEKEKEKEKGFALDADAAVSRVTRRVRACQRPVWHPWSRTHTSQHWRCSTLPLYFFFFLLFLKVVWCQQHLQSSFLSLSLSIGKSTVSVFTKLLSESTQHPSQRSTWVISFFDKNIFRPLRFFFFSLLPSFIVLCYLFLRGLYMGRAFAS